MAAKANYYAQSWSDRYYDERVVVKEEDETDKEIKCEPLTDMVFVQLNSKQPREEDPNCYIYGHISVKVGQSTAALFLRHRESPALVVIDDPRKNSLSLPAGADSPPPLEAVTRSNPILLTMKLYEKKSSGEDELLVEVTDFEHDDNVQGRCSCFEIDLPGSNFWFVVGFAVMWGARAEIQVRIRPPAGDQGEGESPVPVGAKIEAIQYLNECHCCCSQSVRTIYHKSEELCAGDKLLLERSVFGLPMTYEQFLSILIRPDTDEDETHYSVDFPFKLATKKTFVTNGESTHTKDVRGTPFSVTIKILPIPEVASR